MSNEAEPVVGSDIEQLKAAGNQLCAVGDYLGAIAVYTQCLDRLREQPDPCKQTLGAILSNRSLCFFSAGRFEQALGDADECAACRPKWAKAHFRRAASLFQLERWRDCLAAYDAGLVLEPKNAGAIKSRSEALFLAKVESRPAEPAPHPPPARTRASPSQPPPPAAEQKAAIAELVSPSAPWLSHRLPVHDTAPAGLVAWDPLVYRTSLRRGTRYCVLAATWWQSWTANVGWHDEPPVLDTPGVIDNFPLLEVDENADLKPDLLLLHHLRSGVDYVLVPEPVWALLVQWYGGGPLVVRQVELGGLSRSIPFVNTHPIRLRFTQWMSNGRTPPERTVQRHFVAAQSATLKELLNLLCAKLYPSPPHRSRLWRLAPKPITTFNKEHLTQTLLQCGICNDAVILVETAEQTAHEDGPVPSLAGFPRPA